MGMGEDLVQLASDSADQETQMEARVTAALAALNTSLAALQANPTAAQTQQAISTLQAEKDKLVAFQANPSGPPPPIVATTP